MKLFLQSLLAIAAIFTVSSSALPSRDPNAEAIAAPEADIITEEHLLTKRAGKPSWCGASDKWYCAGGTGGSNFADACACIRRSSSSKISVRLYVKDTLTNGRDAYGYVYVYRNGEKWKKGVNLVDGPGYGVTQANWVPFDAGNNNISGVRLYACQPGSTCKEAWSAG